MTVNGTKQIMLLITRKLFWKKGYKDTNLREIVNAYGCKPADNYNLFKIKVDLLLEVSTQCRRKACFSSTAAIQATGL